MRTRLLKWTACAMLSAAISGCGGSRQATVGGTTISNSDMEMLTDCVAFYNVYAAYLKPSYPAESAQYSQMFYKYFGTAFMGEGMLMPKNSSTMQNSVESSKQFMKQRAFRWYSFMQDSTPAVIQQQAIQCNGFEPRMSVIDAGMRRDPKMGGLIQSIDAGINQYMGQR